MERNLKVHIFHISEFGGHSQAACNIREAILAKRESAEVINLNSFQYFYPRTEKFVNAIYTIVIKKIPSLWGKAYDRKTLVKHLMPWRKAISFISFPRLNRYVKLKKPDCFITTQAFPCGLVADYRQRYKSSIPLVAVVTDFHPHSFWVHPFVTKYVVASEEARRTLLQEGVTSDKICQFGIPISVKFIKTCPRAETAAKFGFLRQLKTVLVMGGGLGMGPIDKIVVNLGKIRHDFQIIVICGRNKFLYRNLIKKKEKIKKPMFIFGYVDSVNELMDFSDIIVTKAGGISISEALAKKLAIIISNPIPGQEEFNVDFLLRKKTILRADTPWEIKNTVFSLLEDEDKLNLLKERAWQNSFPASSFKIADLVFQLAQ